MIVLVGAGTLYIATCAPGMLWQDSSLYTYRVLHNDINGRLGLALSHPFYFIIAIAVKYIPFGALPYRLNLLSAAFGAITIANLFLLLRLWLGKILPAIIAAVSLALSWTFWQHATITEIDALFTALLFAELIVLLRYTQTRQIKYLYLLVVFNGLSMATHMWAVFAFASYTTFLLILLFRKQIKTRHFAVVVLMWVVAALPYEFLFVAELVRTGDFTATLASAAFGTLWENQVLNTAISAKIVLENIVFILFTFPTPNFILFFVGLWVLRKVSPARSFANIIIALLVSYFLFAFRYTIPYRHAFFILFYCICAMLIGLGADALLKKYNYKSVAIAMILFTLLPLPTYYFAPSVARKVYKSLGQRRQRPYRDEYTYFLQPWKCGYRGAERFANESLDMVEKDAVIWADSTMVHTLLYMQQAEGKRSDVKIVSSYFSSENAPVFTADTIGSLIKISAVYVVSPLKSYCPDFVLERYDFVQSGVLWRVVERK